VNVDEEAIGETTHQLRALPGARVPVSDEPAVLLSGLLARSEVERMEATVGRSEDVITASNFDPPIVRTVQELRGRTFTERRRCQEVAVGRAAFVVSEGATGEGRRARSPTRRWSDRRASEC
jgi:hypothetical protein